MPVALHSFKIDDDGQIRLCHTFYADTETQAKGFQRDHARDCPHYGPALAQGRTIDIVEDLDELPIAEEGALLELLGFEDEEEIDGEELEEDEEE